MNHGAIMSFYNHAPSHSIDFVIKPLEIKMGNEARVKPNDSYTLLAQIRLNMNLNPK